MNTDFLSQREKLLYEQVKKFHKGQFRKFTNETVPYHTHPLAVAKLVKEAKVNSSLAVSVALTHDVPEDVYINGLEIDKQFFIQEVVTCGYLPSEALQIWLHAVELKNYYTKERFPDRDKSTRNFSESVRLGFTDHVVQSVKCADIIDNCTNITKADLKFATYYLPLKKIMLSKMNSKTCSFNLYAKACQVILNEQDEIYLEQKLTA